MEENKDFFEDFNEPEHSFTGHGIFFMNLLLFMLFLLFLKTGIGKPTQPRRDQESIALIPHIALVAVFKKKF
jgi:hypothetical protein